MKSVRMKKIAEYCLLAIVLVFSYYVSRVNYLLFHTSAELFSIIISSCIFVIAWASREKSKSHFFIFIGIAYLFVGGIDFFHTLSYKGMHIIPGDIFYANQLWIGARYIESLSILIFSIFIHKNYKLRYTPVFWGFFLITSLLLLSIFYFKNFPTCFIPGVGQTTFKIVSEYLIVLILSISIFVIFKQRKKLEKKILQYLFISIAFTIISEFMFTLYTDNFGVTNVMGHISKIISFYFVYKSVIVINIEKPFSLVFLNLSNKIEEISTLNLQLETANQTKNRFFSIIAHDLKNPILGLSHLLGLMDRRWEKFSEPEKKEYIHMLNETSNRTANLLENLLLWSKNQMQSEKVNKKEIVIHDLIENNITLFAERLHNKQIKIENQVPKETKLYADEDMINTVLRNLVNNAIKFSYRNRKIEVFLEENEKKYLINIKDNGIGIPEENQEKLFHLTSSIHQKGTENEEGTGLGLILCKELMEKNNGRLLFVSQEGVGSIFTMEFEKPDKQEE